MSLEPDFFDRFKPRSSREERDSESCICDKCGNFVSYEDMGEYEWCLACEKEERDKELEEKEDPET